MVKVKEHVEKMWKLYSPPRSNQCFEKINFLKKENKFEIEKSNI